MACTCPLGILCIPSSYNLQDVASCYDVLVNQNLNIQLQLAIIYYPPAGMYLCLESPSITANVSSIVSSTFVLDLNRSILMNHIMTKILWQIFLVA